MASWTTITLGIDLGTTSVKVAAKTRAETIECCEPHGAEMRGARIPKGTQDSAMIVRKAYELMDTLHATLKERRPNEEFHVPCIAVSSQMHGVCTWNAKDVIENGKRATPSRLYTWEFDSYDPTIMATLERKYPGQQKGFGCTTLANLYAMHTAIPRNHDRAGTIGDYLVAVLTGASYKNIMNVQMANSFGFYQDKKWIGMAAADDGWQPLLPSSIDWPEEETAGYTNEPYGGKEGSNVFLALGDLQATLYKIEEKITNDEFAKTIVLNLGTSSQLTFCREGSGEFKAFEKDVLASRPHCRVDPYFAKGEIVVCASMNGGNMVEQMITSIAGRQLNNNEMADLMKETDKFAVENEERDENARSTIRCIGLSFAERGADSHEKARIDGNDAQTPLEEVAYAACERVVSNLFSLLPIPAFLNKICLTGAAGLSRFSIPIARQVAELNNHRAANNQLTVVTCPTDESTSAAAGAAQFASRAGRVYAHC